MKNWKDAIIMLAAGGGVALLVAGAEVSLPLLAASGVVVAGLATAAKLAARVHDDNTHSGYRPASHDSEAEKHRIAYH